MRARRRVRFRKQFCPLAALTLAAVSGHACAMPVGHCEKVVMTGEVSAGQEWKSEIGQGWVFRIVPIVSGKAGYSGWDLVIDRVAPAGFPDALLLATLPYNSINEREVGTTFGLRAQDAIGWNPRSFKFLSDPAAFHEGQRLFHTLGLAPANRQNAMDPSHAGSPDKWTLARLLDFQKDASSGELRILDARLAPGIGDAAQYAQNWALAAAKTPYRVESALSGRPSDAGSLNWIRFSVILWLPNAWKVPARLHGISSGCSE
jgi:hypothetical protein